MIDLQHLPGATVAGERQMAVIRRHPITLIPLIVSLAFAFLIPVVLLVGGPRFFPAFFADPARQVLLVLGASLFFLFSWLFLFQTFLEYWLDVAILTDKRLVDIDQTGLFRRSVSELRLHRVQDVTAETKGFFQSMFNYGDVYVQTAGEVERFEFLSVSDPNGVSKQILQLAEIDRAGQMEETLEELGPQRRPAGPTKAA